LAFYGYRAAASGPLSGFAGVPFGYVGQGIVGDIGFDTQYADSYWRQGGLGAPYAPPSGSVLTNSSAQWTKLQELVDAGAPSAGRARARLQNLRDLLTGYVSTLEGWVAQRYDFARERADYFVQMNVVRVYDGINAALKAFADEAWPDAYEETAQAEEKATADAAAARAAQKAAADAAAAAQKKADADAAATRARLDRTQAAISEAKAAIDAANTAKVVAAASAVKHKELQAIAVQKSATIAGKAPWILGGLAVLSAGAIFFARRGKSSKTAGYRRRK
jgi:hypothetical protein